VAEKSRLLTKSASYLQQGFAEAYSKWHRRQEASLKDTISIETPGHRKMSLGLGMNSDIPDIKAKGERK
jgi:hypothetical protein